MMPASPAHRCNASAKVSDRKQENVQLVEVLDTVKHLIRRRVLRRAPEEAVSFSHRGRTLHFLLPSSGAFRVHVITVSFWIEITGPWQPPPAPFRLIALDNLLAVQVACVVVGVTGLH